VISELVSNGLTHGARGQGEIGVRCQRVPAGVVVEVRDPGPGFRPPGPPVLPPAAQRGGRGLYLIHALTTRWGTARGEGGFVVWAEIRDTPVSG
jgi:anti-sigma regulatory factor (Ser/Thr protein kinase)